MKTKIINFFGGPGSGKSTLAGELFGYLKHERKDVEYVSEFAKDLTWEKRHLALDNQMYVFGEQFHRMYRLLNDVEFIITDSPLLLSNIYIDEAFEKFKTFDALETLKVNFKTAVLYSHFAMGENYNYFVDRKGRKYLEKGRNQKEEEAIVIDKKIRNYLDGCIGYDIINKIEPIIKRINGKEK